MNIGVEVLKESVIRVQSQLNDWMDCVFVVSKDDEEKAREVLERRYEKCKRNYGVIGNRKGIMRRKNKRELEC